MRLSALIFASLLPALPACKRSEPAPPPPAKSTADPAAFGLDPVPIAPSGPANTRVDTSVPMQVSPLPSGQRPPAAAPAGRGDIDITNDVRQALTHDSTLSRAAQLVDVSTSNGVVVLSGSLLSEADKENLRVAVARVAGVRAIDNRIIVKR